MIRTVFPMSTEYDADLPLVVKGIGVQNNQEHICRPSGFPYYHWAHCTKGEGNLLIGGNMYKITEGMGFFFRPDIPHEYYPTKEPWEIYWIVFEGHSLPGLLNPLNFGEWNVLTFSSLQSIDLILKDIYLCVTSEDPNKVIKASSLLYQFLIKIKSSTVLTNGAERERHEQLAPVISYMESNFHKYTSLEKMASIIDVTPYHLCRLFKQTYHISPFKYLTRLRMQKAKELLVEFPDMAVRTVSQKIGYNDTSYFCSVFKAHEGITPMEFKRMHGIV